MSGYFEFLAMSAMVNAMSGFLPMKDRNKKGKTLPLETNPPISNDNSDTGCTIQDGRCRIHNELGGAYSA